MGAHLSACIGLSLTIAAILVQFPGPVQAVAVQLFEDGAVENRALADAVSAVQHELQAHAGMELAVGRRGGGVMMTSGSFTMMSSNRAGNSEEDEEDAELAESGGGPVEDSKSELQALETKETHYKTASKQLLSQIKSIKANATYVPSNGAKCAGNKQDQSRIIGTMNCDSVQPVELDKKQENKPEKCPDNLSGGSYWVCTGQGGNCLPFHGLRAITRQAYVVMHNKYEGQVCQDVVTKGAVAHPHRAERNVGVLALKRVKCNEENPPKCEVFKTAVCISVPKDECPSTKMDEGICKMFKNKTEMQATDEELTNFAKHVSKNAWVNAGKPTAKLKQGWSCTGNDRTIADGWIRAW